MRARIDPLSSTLNRQTFFLRLERAMTTSRTGLLLLLDADHFKSINDTYGHSAGDRCISAIGHRLNWHLREVDLAGRVGGEEFAVFLADVSTQHGRSVATRIGQPVSFSDGGDALNLSASMSVGAVWIERGMSADDYMAKADEALYEAKMNGRARFGVLRR